MNLFRVSCYRTEALFRMTNAVPTSSDGPGDPQANCAGLRRSYNELSYGSSADWTTHPDLLAALAALHGLDPAPLDSCRILEIGCSCGGNLTPIAESLPGSRCLGIDISDVQIDKARASAAEAGLTNVEFRAANVFDVDTSIGKFDYIICAGVFSWVPAEVQEQILKLFGDCLSDRGVAYLSFNAYPGWHLRAIVRETLQRLTAGIEDPAAKAAAARKILAKLDEAEKLDKNRLKLINFELDALRETRDSYLYHEHLVEHNTAFFFADVMQRASKYNLAYLADIPPLEPEIERLAAEICANPADRIELQQTADFLEVRQYHCSLLCRSDLAISTPTVDRLRRLALGTDFRPVAPDPVVTTAKAEEFTREEGNLTTEHPFVKAAIVVLSRRHPAAMSYVELWPEVRELLLSGSDPFPLEEDTDEPAFADALMYCYARGIVWLRMNQPEIAFTVPELPRVTRFARGRANSDDSVPNLMHSQVKLTPLQRQILPYLDGNNTRTDILAAVVREVSALSLSQGPPSEQQINEALENLARQAMFLRPTATTGNA